MKSIKFKLILILILMAFFISSNAKAKDISDIVDDALSVAENRAKIRNMLTIQEINKKAPKFGTYYIEGYVSKIYTCPPCPSGSLCKMCMQDNVVVSSKKKFLKDYDLSDSDIIVFVDDIEQFEIGKKYRMLIKILDVKTTNQTMNNVKLIYHEQIRG